MALPAGTRFGPYAISAPIGAGGMGEVYRATDTNLKREVAIKILPQTFAADADRVARFQREAEALAALNHPNIAQIHGLERSDGSTAIVMELVDGPTLADRIEQGPISYDEALGIALQLADALEAAHGRGIVHRDLKPANIKLRPDGTVKVLDFGIATAPESRTATSGRRSPTLLTPALTEAGILLGTAAYMSPEQARGKPVDERADIWAFGCLLYEMLTGQPAFGGEDVTTTLARVLEREANTAALPAAVPPAARRTIELCLEKDPRRRIAHIRDVRLALGGAFETRTRSAEGGPAGSRSLKLLALPLTAAVVLTGVLVGMVSWSLWPAAEPGPLNRFDWDFPGNQSDLFASNAGSVLALAPDGRHFVYMTPEGLRLRSMDQLEAPVIPGTEGELAFAPFFSADSRSVAYFTQAGQLKRIGIDGGTPVVVADALGFPLGATWGSDGAILFGATDVISGLSATGAGVFRVAASGGTPERVISGAGELLYGPQVLPDGDSILLSTTTFPVQSDKVRIVAQSLSTGRRTVLIDGGTAPRYVPSGHLIYAVDDRLFGVAFDAATLTVTGTAVPLVSGVLRGAFGTPAANFGIAADGTLAYISAPSDIPEGAFTLVWVDRQGVEEPLGLAPCVCMVPALSPDGTRVAVQVIAGDISDADIGVFSIAQRTLTLLSDAGFQEAPLWTPDSGQITYSSGDGLYLRPADGSGQREALLLASTFPAAWAWTADGDLVVGNRQGATRSIAALAVAGNREMQTLLTTSANLRDGALSPDGRWLAYESDESGQSEIYVRPYPDLETARTQVSSGGGREPKWTGDGRTLFFRGPEDLMATTVTATASFSFEPPKAVLDIRAYAFASGPPRTYDISPDGQRFLLVKRVADAGTGYQPPQLIVVQNWLEEVKRRVPAE